MKHMMLYTLLLLAACGRNEVATYQVPKEQTAAPAAKTESPVPVATPPASGFTAESPETWTERPGTGMRMVSYSIADTSIDFYLISLSMGDVPSNVNRWRGQVGLPPASAEEIQQDVQAFQTDRHDVNYIEIYNAESGKGIIAAIVDLAPRYWYFTAKGSVDELKAHAADIRSFLESIRFEGHNH